jgi:hypothetical protein
VTLILNFPDATVTVCSGGFFFAPFFFFGCTRTWRTTVPWHAFTAGTEQSSMKCAYPFPSTVLCPFSTWTSTTCLLPVGCFCGTGVGFFCCGAGCWFCVTTGGGAGATSSSRIVSVAVASPSVAFVGLEILKLNDLFPSLAVLFAIGTSTVFDACPAASVSDPLTLV